MTGSNVEQWIVTIIQLNFRIRAIERSSSFIHMICAPVASSLPIFCRIVIQCFRTIFNFASLIIDDTHSLYRAFTLFEWKCFLRRRYSCTNSMIFFLVSSQTIHCRRGRSLFQLKESWSSKCSMHRPLIKRPTHDLWYFKGVKQMDNSRIGKSDCRRQASLSPRFDPHARSANVDASHDVSHSHWIIPIRPMAILFSFELREQVSGLNKLLSNLSESQVLWIWTSVNWTEPKSGLLRIAYKYQ